MHTSSLKSEYWVFFLNYLYQSRVNIHFTSIIVVTMPPNRLKRFKKQLNWVSNRSPLISPLQRVSVKHFVYWKNVPTPTSIDHSFRKELARTIFSGSYILFSTYLVHRTQKEKIWNIILMVSKLFVREQNRSEKSYLEPMRHYLIMLILRGVKPKLTLLGDR